MHQHRVSRWAGGDGLEVGTAGPSHAGGAVPGAVLTVWGLSPMEADPWFDNGSRRNICFPLEKMQEYFCSLCLGIFTINPLFPICFLIMSNQ